jgi:hypothetical protein
LLLILTVCGALVVPTFSVPKERLAGENVTGVSPVPVRFSRWGEPPALSVTVTSPGTRPGTVGLNVTVIEQELPAARLDGLSGQLCVTE